jgi:hypothetical protein
MRRRLGTLRSQYRPRNIQYFCAERSDSASRLTLRLDFREVPITFDRIRGSQSAALRECIVLECKPTNTSRCDMPISSTGLYYRFLE